MGENAGKLTSGDSVPYIAKLIELCLSIIIIGLIVDPTNNGILSFNEHHSALVYVSWGGYIIINSILLLCHAAGDRVPKKTQILFAFVGGCLFLAASAVVLEDYRKVHKEGPGGIEKLVKSNLQQYKDQTLASGIIGLICTLTFFIDVFLSFKYSA